MTPHDFWTPARIAETVKGRWITAPRNIPPPVTAPPVTGLSIDTRTIKPDEAYLAIKGDTHDGHRFIPQAIENGASLIIAENADAQNAPVLLVTNTRTALTDLARAWRNELTHPTVIAITGSAGKTTTKAMIHAVLSTTKKGTANPKSFNNDLGVPLTILAARSDDDYLITEIGTNAPGEIATLAAIARPDIAIITNIGRSHLAGLGSIQGVAREKAALLAALPESGMAIVHADSPAIEPEVNGGRDAHATEKRMATNPSDDPGPFTNLIRFGFGAAADVRVTAHQTTTKGTTFTLADGSSWHVALPGRHQVANALPAIILGRHFGMDDHAINAALGTVAPASMRFERELIGEIVVHNDAYNANPESMAASIETFAAISHDARSRVLILGDMLELGEYQAEAHAALGDLIANHHEATALRLVILFGEAMSAAADAIRNRDSDLPLIHHPEASDEAIGEAASLVLSGDSLLLKASRGLGLERIVPILRNRMT